MLSFLKKIIPERSILRTGYSLSKALLARLKHGNQSQHLRVIGITGTDGKTSSCHFTAHLLELLGEKVAMASTEEIWMNGEKKENSTKRTTLSPMFLQTFLKEAREKNVTTVVLEVSSHAITQQRIYGIDFDGAAITNISQEHGNYHTDMKEYAETKAELFKLVRKSSKDKKILLTNKDMGEFFELFSKILPEAVQTYSLESHADILAKNIEYTSESSHFQVNNTDMTLNIPGSYNIENILISIGFAQFFGYNMIEIQKQLPHITPVLGRLEKIDTPTDYEVFVDFAVTPGALEKVLTSLKSVCTGKTWLVFGCTGGNHDQEKRPLMGNIATTYADHVVMTEDETYGEDNDLIFKDILTGVTRKNYTIIEDRKDAIFYALEHAEKNDMIIVTGMGNFSSRNNGVAEIPWNDKEVILSYF